MVQNNHGALGGWFVDRLVYIIWQPFCLPLGLTPVCAPSTPAYFPAFLVSRFFAGFGGIGTFLLSLCLALEYVDSRHRYLVGILIQVRRSNFLFTYLFCKPTSLSTFCYYIYNIYFYTHKKRFMFLS